VRRTVDAVLLVADHNHPHVLLLQVTLVQRSRATTGTASSSRRCKHTVAAPLSIRVQLRPYQAAKQQAVQFSAAVAGLSCVLTTSGIQLELLRRTLMCSSVCVPFIAPVLQYGQSNFYKLPGGKLKPDEDGEWFPEQQQQQQTSRDTTDAADCVVPVAPTTRRSRAAPQSAVRRLVSSWPRQLNTYAAPALLPLPLLPLLPLPLLLLLQRRLGCAASLKLTSPQSQSCCAASGRSGSASAAGCARISTPCFIPTPRHTSHGQKRSGRCLWCSCRKTATSG
jgi:hypothetical protein